MHHTTTTGHGVTVHVGGRNRPAQTPQSHPHLFRGVHEFLGSEPLPTPPNAFSYFAGASCESDILGNNYLGNCTAAGACHGIEAVTYAAGNAVTCTEDTAVKFYSLSTGYVPGNPSTDQGG